MFYYRPYHAMRFHSIPSHFILYLYFICFSIFVFYSNQLYSVCTVFFSVPALYLVAFHYEAAYTYSIIFYLFYSNLFHAMPCHFILFLYTIFYSLLFSSILFCLYCSFCAALFLIYTDQYVARIKQLSFWPSNILR